MEVFKNGNGSKPSNKNNEYVYMKHDKYYAVPKSRFSFAIIMVIFQVTCLFLYGFFAKFQTNETDFKKYPSIV